MQKFDQLMDLKKNGMEKLLVESGINCLVRRQKPGSCLLKSMLDPGLMQDSLVGRSE